MSPEGIAELCSMARKIPKASIVEIRKVISVDDAVYNTIFISEKIIKYSEIVEKMSGYKKHQITNALTRLVKTRTVEKHGTGRCISYSVRC